MNKDRETVIGFKCINGLGRLDFNISQKRTAVQKTISLKVVT